MGIEASIKFFTSTFPSLTQDDVAAVLKISKVVEHDGGTILIPAGSCKMFIVFIVHGLVRAYYIKENGQEMTPFFWTHNDFLASWESIYLHKPSQLNFETLEPTTVLVTDFVEFKRLVNTNDAIRRAYLSMMEIILTKTLISTQTVKNEKPEDRYLLFMQESIDIASRISQKHMASYLGITPISFSRMKKRMGK